MRRLIVSTIIRQSQQQIMVALPGRTISKEQKYRQ